MKYSYNPLRSIGAWRSPASALAWGARGRRFKSSRPDSTKGTALTGRFYFSMDSNEIQPSSPLNTKSILSLVFAVLTLLTFCTGWLPVPFTGIICFPASFLLGILALTYGTISLRQIRQRNETGHPMAWTGVIIGGFVFVCVLCMLIAIISIFLYSPDLLPTPPFLQNPQI